VRKVVAVPAGGRPVHLNVGGTPFLTTMGTLRSDPECMLAALVSETFCTGGTAEDPIFIDRDGRYFVHILNWLRDRRVPAGLSVEARASLCAEADYYSLVHLSEALARVDASATADLTRIDVWRQLAAAPVSAASRSFRGLNLACIDLRHFDLQGADFSGANLQGADLSFANCAGANFTRANLAGAVLADCDARKSNFAHANLRRAILTNAALHECNLSSANFADAILTNAVFSNANLTNCNVSEGRFKHASREVSVELLRELGATVHTMRMA
jgi:hypothetical protein